MTTSSGIQKGNLTLVLLHFMLVTSLVIFCELVPLGTFLGRKRFELLGNDLSTKV